MEINGNKALYTDNPLLEAAEEEAVIEFEYDNMGDGQYLVDVNAIYPNSTHSLLSPAFWHRFRRNCKADIECAIAAQLSEN